nr:hypothetical protein YSBCXYJI_YSBCXYJI_CDS_0112 [Caudoviricetes sp.]
MNYHCQYRLDKHPIQSHYRYKQDLGPWFVLMSSSH